MSLLMALLLTGSAMAAASKTSAAPFDKDAGSKIYARCAGCHGPSGKGNPGIATMLRLPPETLDLTGKKIQSKTDADLVKIILGGKDKMPSFKGKLSDQEVADVVAYLSGFKPAAGAGRGGRGPAAPPPTPPPAAPHPQ